MNKAICIFVNNFPKQGRKILFAFIILLTSLVKLSAQTEKITVLSNQQMDTNTAFMQGFVIGGTNFNIPLTQELEPAFWELGWDIIQQYDYITPNFNVETMVSISTAFMRRYNTDGDPQHLTPWADGWVQWDGFVDTIINLSLSTSRPVDYWVAFGEPDNDFSGTPAQYIEMLRRTDSILKAADPTAKLIAPDFIAFSPGQMLWIVDTLHDLNVHLAAVAWHEYGSYAPENVVTHVQQMRDSLAARPYAVNTKIFIPEYGIPDHRLIPGWNVGWIHYFEKSKIDWSSHGCFDEYDGNVVFDDCFDGALSGMYMSDGTTPQPLYWFSRAYAELNRPGRLETISDQPRTVALASKNDVNQEMKIIVGRYYSTLMGTQFAPANVDIKIRNYPYGINSIQPIVVQRIPAQTVNYSVPLPNPITVFSGTMNFTGDSAVIPIPSFKDGDVYIIYINPDTGSVLPALNIPVTTDENWEIEIYPNPAADHLNIDYGNHVITTLQIFDITGKAIYQNLKNLGSVSTIRVGEFANGIYILRIQNEEGYVAEKKFVVRH